MLNATIAVIARASKMLRAARAEMSRIEYSPRWNGEMRTIKVSKPVVDASGKAVRDFTTDPEKYPKGKVVRESVTLEVPVSVSAQYRRATKNRQNAARRVARAEARFALLCNEMDVTDVKDALRKLYEATA
jgi:hypothetical protein